MVKRLKNPVGLYINPELNSAVQKGPNHQANTANRFFFCTTTASMQRKQSKKAWLRCAASTLKPDGISDTLTDCHAQPDTRPGLCNARFFNNVQHCPPVTSRKKPVSPGTVHNVCRHCMCVASELLHIAAEKDAFIHSVPRSLRTQFTCFKSAFTHNAF